MAHKPKSKEQEYFLTNVQRAQAAGVTTETSQSVRKAIFEGLNYCNFGHSVADLTDDYLVFLQDMLANEAMDQEKYDKIKWIGFG